jgi:formamidopyrimidine-DNA glycosylase
MPGLTDGERGRLYAVIRGTLKAMVELGGRNTERDMYNRFGGYPVKMSTKSKGEPCTVCGTAIEKLSIWAGRSITALCANRSRFL